MSIVAQIILLAYIATSTKLLAVIPLILTMDQPHNHILKEHADKIHPLLFGNDPLTEAEKVSLGLHFTAKHRATLAWQIIWGLELKMLEIKLAKEMSLNQFITKYCPLFPPRTARRYIKLTKEPLKLRKVFSDKNVSMGLKSAINEMQKLVGLEITKIDISASFYASKETVSLLENNAREEAQNAETMRIVKRAKKDIRNYEELKQAETQHKVLQSANKDLNELNSMLTQLNTMIGDQEVKDLISKCESASKQAQSKISNVERSLPPSLATSNAASVSPQKS